MGSLCTRTCEAQLFVDGSTRHREERALVRCNDGRDERVGARVAVLAEYMMVNVVFFFSSSPSLCFSLFFILSLSLLHVFGRSSGGGGMLCAVCVCVCVCVCVVSSILPSLLSCLCWNDAV